MMENGNKAAFVEGAVHLDLENEIIKEDMENIYLRQYNWKLLEGKTVLVTGSYGMLASYIVCFLMYLRIEKGIQVSVIAQGRNKVKARRRFARFWDADGFIYCGQDIVEDTLHLPHVNYIVHAASPADPQHYAGKPVEVIAPNAVGTYQLLKLAQKRGAEGFLYFSTGDVYGKVMDADEIYEDTMGYMDPLDEHSCYGESKRLGEAFCAAFHREYGIRAVIARIGHTYGPTMDTEKDSRVFSDFMKCALNGTDLVLHSDGMSKRPFCYITDATAAFLLLLLNGAGGEAYNVTNTGQFLNIRELAEIIAGIPERKLDVKFQVRDKKDPYLNNKLNQENKPVEYKLQKLGWYAEYDAVTGFSRVYQYLRNIEVGYKNGRKKNDKNV